MTTRKTPVFQIKNKCYLNLKMKDMMIRTFFKLSNNENILEPEDTVERVIEKNLWI